MCFIELQTGTSSIHNTYPGVHSVAVQQQHIDNDTHIIIGAVNWERLDCINWIELDWIVEIGWKDLE